MYGLLKHSQRSSIEFLEEEIMYLPWIIVANQVCYVDKKDNYYLGLVMTNPVYALCEQERW